jgi:hypothetical protein
MRFFLCPLQFFPPVLPIFAGRKKAASFKKILKLIWRPSQQFISLEFF